MRLSVSMTTEKNEFDVSSWWARTPEFVVSSLRSQLEAATAVWPELRRYSIRENTGSASARGVKGGHALAALMTPEQRTERAKAAANARWGNNTKAVEERPLSAPAAKVET